jgi:hypothetical protein
VVAVEYSPDSTLAVVLVEFNEPPAVEPYVVLCEATRGGWIAGHGSAGGGSSWMATKPDGSVGVEVTWGASAYSVEWDVAGGLAP